MEIGKVELAVVADTAKQSEALTVLKDLELALVGGGVGDVAF